MDDVGVTPISGDLHIWKIWERLESQLSPVGGDSH